MVCSTTGMVTLRTPWWAVLRRTCTDAVPPSETLYPVCSNETVTAGPMTSGAEGTADSIVPSAVQIPAAAQA